MGDREDERRAAGKPRKRQESYYCGGGRRGNLQVSRQAGIRKGVERCRRWKGGKKNLGAADAEGACRLYVGTRELAEKSYLTHLIRQ